MCVAIHRVFRCQMLHKVRKLFQVCELPLEPCTRERPRVTGSDTEVGAAFFVRPPSLLRGVSAAAAALRLQARLFPLPVAGSVLSVPFL